MKKICSPVFRSLLLIGFAAFLYGCPSGSDYPLAEKPNKIDPAIIGVWEATDDEAEVLEVKIQKRDDYSYTTEVLSSSYSYSLDAKRFISWVTEIDGHKFFYSQPVDDPEDKKYYLYHYDFDGNFLIIHDVGLLAGGIDAVKSTASYRAEVVASLEKSDCLSSPHEYQRIDD